MTEGFRERFLDEVCDREIFFVLLVAINLMLMLLLGLSFPYLERGTASFVIAVVGAVFIIASLIGLGAVLWLCQRRKEVE